VVGLKVGLAVVARTLDDDVGREPFNGGGLDLNRNESAIPGLTGE